MLAGRRRCLVQPRVLHPGPRLRVRDELPVLAHAARGVFSWTPSPRQPRSPRTRRPPRRCRTAAAAADDTGASLRALALAQWGDCSPLGGASITTLPLPAETVTKFPVAPEFGAYASTAAAPRWTPPPPGSSGDALLASTYAALATSSNAVLGLQTLRRRPRDVVGRVRDARAFRERHVGARRPVVAAGADDDGVPFLGPSSSGLFVARTVREWILGYVDPLTSSRVDPSDPRYLVRAVTKTFHADDLDGPNAIDRVPWTVEDVSSWPGLGATPWTVATGRDDPERAWDVLVSTKGDALNDTYARRRRR